MNEIRAELRERELQSVGVEADRYIEMAVDIAQRRGCSVGEALEGIRIAHSSRFEEPLNQLGDGMAWLSSCYETAHWGDIAEGHRLEREQRRVLDAAPRKRHPTKEGSR